MPTANLIPAGTRVVVDASHLDTIPLKAQIHGRVAVVLAYATPDIQRRQVWTAESYYVRLEDDAPNVQRVMDRASLVVLP